MKNDAIHHDGDDTVTVSTNVSATLGQGAPISITTAGKLRVDKRSAADPTRSTTRTAPRTSRCAAEAGTTDEVGQPVLAQTTAVVTTAVAMASSVGVETAAVDEDNRMGDASAGAGRNGVSERVSQGHTKKV